MIVLLVILCLVQAPVATTSSPKLVNENGANTRFRDGVWELRGGGGWLRTEHALLDFEVTFEIRALTPEADPGLIVRTWRGWQLWPDRGYRLTLPTGRSMEVSKLLTGRQQQFSVRHEGQLSLHPHGEWQRVHVAGQRGTIRVAVNDVLAAEFTIENPGGYLMFDNRKGRVEIRHVTLQTRDLNEVIPTDVVREKDLKKSGGTSPEVLYEMKPAYTPEAMRAKVQGTVGMEAVVFADGTVGPVRVTRSRDRDLDIAAVAALKGWRFRPATLNGAPVPAIVEVEMTFTLR